MKKTPNDSKISPEDPADATATASAPARKRAVKKTVSEPAATPPAAAAIEEKAPAKKTAARKTVAKKAAKSLPEPAPEPPVLVLQAEEATPAPSTKAKAVKKVASKKTAAPLPASDAPLPVSQEEPVSSSLEIPKTAAPDSLVTEAKPDRVPAKKSARPAKSGKTLTSPSPTAPAEASAGDGERDFHKAAASEAPSPPFSPDPEQSRPENASPNDVPEADSPPGQAAGSYRENGGPRESREGDSRPPRPDREFENRGPNGPGSPGPDGEGRRLTKWERWKLRKEKFKLQKQQRYLERTGRAPQGSGTGPAAPGPNGHGPQGPADPASSPDRRDPRDTRDPRDQREPRDPRDQREPRTWEPRPPRPEPVLGPPEDCEGLLELTDGKGFGFLRPRDKGFIPSPQDPFVSAELVRQLGLRDGVYVDAVMRRGGRGPMVQEITKVNGLEANSYRTLPLFEELTAVNPNKRYILETEANRNTTRIIDFISPIGRGQRGLIVAPPRAGKTTFLQHIAEAMLQKYPEVKVIVLLVDERPEEVTELSRALPGAEIMASSNDQDPRNHIRMAHLAIERAKRLVEAGQHVFMLLDSITRLARGFNNAIRGGGGGKAMSGGLDSRALEAPRRLFAAARNTREAGSLTIMATALVETNNKGDDLIFQEFKGTGNMELVLDRKISQQYVYPAVDIFKSGTRREELLLPAHQLEKVHLIRRGLSGHRPSEAVERLLQVMGKYPNNNQMLLEIKARE